MLAGAEPGLSGVGGASERGLSYRRGNLAKQFAVQAALELSQLAVDAGKESSGSGR